MIALKLMNKRMRSSALILTISILTNSSCLFFSAEQENDAYWSFSFIGPLIRYTWMLHWVIIAGSVQFIRVKHKHSKLK